MFEGDFCGISKVLQELNIGGTFVTSSDIYLKVVRTGLPIKCERSGMSRIVVSLEEARSENRWYTTINSPIRLKDFIINWIDQKCQEAVPGDAVDIILLGHGYRKNAAFYCGPGVGILPIELTRACRPFKAGVQVNMISNSCHSGGIADMFEAEGHRNRFIHTAATRLEQAWGIRSASGQLRNTKFGTTYVDNIPKLHCLGTHTRLVREAVKKEPYPSTPQTYESDVKISDMVEDIIFREYVSIAHDEEKGGNRQSRIFSSSFKSFNNYQPSLDTATKARAIGIIETEYE